MPHRPRPKGSAPPAASSSGAAQVGESSAQAAASTVDRQQPSAENNSSGQTKKKRHRAGKKRRARRQSFATTSDTTEVTEPLLESSNLPDVAEGQAQAAFYRLGERARGSNTSLDSEALLDHRDHGENTIHIRKQSSNRLAAQAPRASTTARSPNTRSRPQTEGVRSEDDENADVTSDRTPLILHQHYTTPSNLQGGYGGLGTSQGSGRRQSNMRRPSQSSNSTGWARNRSTYTPAYTPGGGDDYDIYNPPSVPGSPRLASQDDYNDVLIPNFISSPDASRRDTVINIDETDMIGEHSEAPGGGDYFNTQRRRQTEPEPEDVCIPFEREEEGEIRHPQETSRHRRHRRMWPDLEALEEWSQVEKEERTQEGLRAKKVDEPVVIGGRLRPRMGAWRREDEEAPFRWTYFNEEMDTSLRSHTISGLQQLGHSFRELFIPDPPELESDSSDDEDDFGGSIAPDRPAATANDPPSRATTRQSSLLDTRPVVIDTKHSSGDNTPSKHEALGTGSTRPKRYGPRPVFWLDVLQPTWEEMRVLSRAFGIHKLTAEDIMEQEAREKVELFRNYYFVNYRTFEQDDKSEDYLDPVNMYFVVFKGGLISFHFSQMPHPPNVRRRIRQLSEHQYTDSDWISYAIIDNITDAYAPLIESIETEVDAIDDEILQLNSTRDHGTEYDSKKIKSATKSLKGAVYEKLQDNEQTSTPDSGRNMLLRVGECRKRVMGLYRLLGSKADVIKGLAKRCNEQTMVAPKSDVGLYLGDIQDHLITMNSNLTHYENILSRAHSNYLAQINLGMNERAEKTADVLGKLTVLGTIVLPMNVVTGLWGMNCRVLWENSEIDSLVPFFGITAFLVLFGFVSYMVTKKVYSI